MPVKIISKKVAHCTCRTCEYEWDADPEQLQKACPNRFCRSIYWNSERVKSTDGEKK